MARPRTPSNVLTLRGSDKKHPERARARSNEPKPDEEIGPAPGHLPSAARICWDEIVRLAHPGTLCSSDRLIVEHGSQLLSELRASDWKVHPTLLIRWEGFLAKLGMTPSDRSKVSVMKSKPDADPLDEFSAAS